MLRDLTKVATGVTHQFDGSRAIYTGTAKALIACGVVEERHLPGNHGQERGMCTIDAEGNPVGFMPGAGPAASRVGHKQIVAKANASGTVYEVRLVLSAERVAAIDAERRASLALAPLQSYLWPFPASYGAQQMGAQA